MSRVLLNVDLGERGIDHPVDLALLGCVDLANIACGGHAGSADGARFWAREATVRGVGVTAHLSYPDRGSFGRRPMELSEAALAAALAEQRALLPDADTVKLHGALYHAADTQSPLARFLARWLADAGIVRVLTPASGALAQAAPATGLAVLAEAFADRRYTRDAATGRAVLLGRDRAGAVLGLGPATEQAARLLDRGMVVVHPSGRDVAFRIDTLCVHGDQPDALPIAEAISARLREPGP